ncbi:MAG: hypothetical protein IPG84_15425 [Betaproteobacteria bacterium]|nr:hypothetical protein [Betaproteobacteria bacterium]
MSPKSLLRLQGGGVDGRRARGRPLPDGDRRDREDRREEGAARHRALVYYDLLAFRRERKIDDVAIVRLGSSTVLTRRLQVGDRQVREGEGSGLRQEEPQNQGAWYRLLAPICAPTSRDSQVLARGAFDLGIDLPSATRRSAEQKQLIEDAFAT